MSGIVIQSNFDLMQSVPIDSRLVATNSIDRDAIQYRYQGLKVYVMDINKTFTWNGVSWDGEGLGIYGGSGSLIGDTYVDLGTISNIAISESNKLVWSLTTDTTKAYLSNSFIRHTNSVPSSEWLGVEYRHQFKYLDSSSNIIDSAYISFNPALAGNDTIHGGISFNTGFGGSLDEKMRITSSGKIGIGTKDPKGDLQIGTSSAIFKPIVIHTKSIGNIAIIGHNWYPSGTGTDLNFDSTIGSSKIVQNNGSIIVQNRPANGSYNNTLFVGTSSRVGIMTTNPSATLDVNGQIRSNNIISGATISSDNIVNAKQYTFGNPFSTSTQYSSTSIFTLSSPIGPSPQLVLRVSGTNSISTDGRDVYLIDTQIIGNLYTSGNSTTDGDLTVNGNITNFETSTILTPTFAYRANDIAEFNTIVPLNSFTYSFSAYRVGALVNLNIEISVISLIPNTGSLFYGYLFKLNSSRFGCKETGFGCGSTDGVNGKKFYPIHLEAFQNDPTTSNTGTTVASVTGNDFYLRIRPARIESSSEYYGDFISSGNIPIGTKFRGTITYIAG